MRCFFAFSMIALALTGCATTQELHFSDQELESMALPSVRTNGSAIYFKLE